MLLARRQRQFEHMTQSGIKASPGLQDIQIEMDIVGENR